MCEKEYLQDHDIIHGLHVNLSQKVSQRGEDGMFFGAAEDYGGLEKGVVIIIGFQHPEYARHRLGSLSRDIDRLVSQVLFHATIMECVCMCVRSVV